MLKSQINVNNSTTILLFSYMFVKKINNSFVTLKVIKKKSPGLEPTLVDNLGKWVNLYLQLILMHSLKWFCFLSAFSEISQTSLKMSNVLVSVK